MNNSRLYLVSILIIWVLLASACGKDSLPTLALESPTLSPTIELALTPAATLTPLPSVMNSPTPSLTPVPTLALADARKMVLSLYKNNGSCKFPCWWGIEPGVTSWHLAKNFLAAFAERISTPSTFDFFGKAKGYSIYFPVDTKSGNRLSLGVMEQDDIVRFIESGIHEELERTNNSTKYLLHALLAEYGSPDQVYVYTQPYTPDSSYPFSVILFYEHQRFALIYFEHGTVQNNQIRGCFKNDFSFLSWAPDTIGELDDFTKVGMSSDEIRQYRQLEDVTELTATTFYETFKKPSIPFCLETPIELWP